MSDQISAVEELLTEPDTSPQRDALEQVNDILLGKEPEGVAVEEPVGDDNTEAAAQEVETPEGVDYALEVPMTDGTKVKLGELKDHYQQYQTHVMEVQERENALMQKYEEVNQLAQYAQLPPERLASIQQQQQRYLEQQHQLMLETMPDLKDKATFDTTKAAIYELAKEYGVEDVIGQVTNHKVVKMLRDYATLRKSIKAAKDNVKPLRSAEPRSKNAPVGKPDAAAMAAQRATQTGSKQDQIAAISALLK